MSLTVDVLAVSPLPLVRLIVALPSGRSWKVTGRAGEAEWLAGEGTSRGGETVFSDPWAPLGVPVTYTLTGGGTWTGGPVVRTYEGQNAVTDLTGRTVADFAWHPTPGNPRTYEPRAVFVDPWGSSLPVPLVGRVAGAGSGALAARTVPPHTGTLRRLVEANRPLLLMHSHSGGRCPIGDCDIPPVQTILLTGVTEDRRLRPDVSERVWDLAYRLVPRPHAYLAPVATWGDVKAHWAENSDLAASGLDNEALRRGDWLVQ
ncbi:MAG TPA: hypothetical protein VK053_21145 [Jiangellaceae bacterium]|nr:hypothetical protein [Jiangellaceae bacterium]